MFNDTTSDKYHRLPADVVQLQVVVGAVSVISGYRCNSESYFYIHYMHNLTT